ncbi:MAG: UbiH/UbiF family hydroxylase [Hyphomicrobiaceae bacterium]
MQTTTMVDCVVVGTGAAGAAVALAVAREGLRTIAIGPVVSADPARDPRSTALFSGSIAFLRHLGVWRHLEPAAARLVGLRLVDDTGGVLRAPEILFRAQELGLSEFGYNIENSSLLQALHECARASDNLDLAQDEVTALTIADEHADVELAHGAHVHARIVVGADGRRSLTRASAAIGTRDWTYPQSAIATRFRHSRPHGGISTEFHRSSGPLTTVPLAEDASSLVWVEEPAETRRLMDLPADRFARELEHRLQGLLGTICDVSARAAFPLAGLSAARMFGHRVALVGEAAHVLPPIGAQGLNLGLRDAATLAEILGDALAAGDDPGGEARLAEYDRRRRADVVSRTIAVDLLNRSLILDFVPLHLLRGAALHMLDAVPWLRRRVMQEGMHPSWQAPRFMRPA